MPSFYLVGDLEIAIMLHAAVRLLRITTLLAHKNVNQSPWPGYTWIRYRMQDSSEYLEVEH
jgi:hypothetical protein